MNFTRYFFTGLLIVLFFTMSIPAQAQMNLKVGGGVGIMSAVSDLNGTTLDYYSGSTYGFNSGMNIHAKAKVGLAGFNITGAIDYSSLGQTGNSEPGQGNVELSQQIVSVRIGPEFQFSIPALPITPYAGVNLASNNFSGEVKFQGVSKVPSATYSMQSASRLGAGITLGAEVGIGPLLTLDFTTAYNFMNISGSEWNDVNPGVDQRLDSYLSLNDRKDPLFAAGSDKHFIANDRSIHSMVFTVSLLFGL